MFYNSKTQIHSPNRSSLLNSKINLLPDTNLKKGFEHEAFFVAKLQQNHEMPKNGISSFA